MSRKGYPQEQLTELDGTDFVSDTLSGALVLEPDGKPATLDELKNRIHGYFEICKEKKIRPGIESLAFALGVSRTTLWRWGNGDGCPEEWAEAVQKAKSVVAVYLEQALLCGKVSPPSGIFLAKNWLSYKDTISFDEAVPHGRSRDRLTNAEIARQMGIGTALEQEE